MLVIKRTYAIIENLKLTAAKKFDVVPYNNIQPNNIAIRHNETSTGSITDNVGSGISVAGYAEYPVYDCVIYKNTMSFLNEVIILSC